MTPVAQATMEQTIFMLLLAARLLASTLLSQQPENKGLAADLDLDAL